MRIIFIGIHNKPGLKPLCSSTKSGKLIDRIIKILPYNNILKTNLYDVDYLPKSKVEKEKLAYEYFCLIKPGLCDIVILLGNEVRTNIALNFSKRIEIKHPASIFSKENQDKYVSKAVAKIIYAAKNK